MMENITHYESLRKPDVAYRGMVSGFVLRNKFGVERNGLKAARKRANLTQDAIAERLSVSVPQISRWESGKDGIPSKRLPAMAEAYSASVEELFGAGRQIGDEEPTVEVELLPTNVGAGGGGTGEGDYLSVHFAKALIHDTLKATPDDMLAILVEGDSMKPEFVSGDQLLVDKRKTSIAQPGAFCLWDGDGYVVKFLEKVPGSDPPQIRVMSENPRYRPVERLYEELRVMGRIVWLGRSL